ncbi:MAG: hypothetical protein OEN55_03350 [Alphaproteobacteria bacterium]|nr:hypothetical protein [Alphaproteobacteria bacterium]
MSLYRYSGRALAGDYLRAGSGLAVTAGPVLLLEPAPAVAAMLAALSILFGAFALRTGLRQLTTVELTNDGIVSRGPVSCYIPWHEVTRLRLDYYATRRESQRGWMQLKIGSRYRRIRVDSTIDGFGQIAATVAGAAREYSIPLTDTAVANFGALGIAVDGGNGEVVA